MERIEIPHSLGFEGLSQQDELIGGEDEECDVSQRADGGEQEGDDVSASGNDLPCNRKDVGQDFKMAGRGWAGRRT